MCISNSHPRHPPSSAAACCLNTRPRAADFLRLRLRLGSGSGSGSGSEQMANSKEAGRTSVGREVTSLEELTPFEKKNVLYHKISWMFWGFSHRERISSALARTVSASSEPAVGTQSSTPRAA